MHAKGTGSACRSGESRDLCRREDAIDHRTLLRAIHVSVSKTDELEYADEVVIPWGFTEVRGRVAEV